MSFRRRIALVAALAVAVAVLLASALIYVLTSNQLHSQLDTQLRSRGGQVNEMVALLREGARNLRARPDRTSLARALGGSVSPSPGRRAHSPRLDSLVGRVPLRPNQVAGYEQLIGPRGAVVWHSAHGVTLPVDRATRRLAQHGGEPELRDARVRGVHVRILSEPLGSGRALQVAQPLTDVDSLLSRLRLILALVCAGGIALAALLGRLVAGAAVLPLKRLSGTAEHVALTRDLSRRISSAGDDELGTLARSFNSMLDALQRSMSALDASVHSQRQLVADASHELRTPVASLRTNIEILQQCSQEMDPREQSALLDEVVEQIEELTLLVNDLIDLARGEEPRADAETLRLDLLVREAAERMRRHSPHTRLELELEPTLLRGVPDRLARAVGNLLDNAVKYGPPAGPVEVALHGQELTVRDHGPGISARDLPHVFDRFYRGDDARARPGSGLGLAIVRQVAEQQGGSVGAEHPPGGGTLMRLRFAGAEQALAPEGSLVGADAPAR
jgi:two-component system, OmpR family, sensor histidine kinase MprB